MDAVYRVAGLGGSLGALRVPSLARGALFREACPLACARGSTCEGGRKVGLAAGAECVDLCGELVSDFLVHHADVSHDFAALGIEEDEGGECVDVEGVGDGLAFFDKCVGVVVLFEVCAGIIDAVVCVDADDEDVVVCGELVVEYLDVW